MAAIAVSRVTSKGQVTIPGTVRARLRLEEGDRIEWATTSRGSVEIRRVGGTLSDLVGVLGKPRRRATISELDGAVRRAIAKAGRARG